MFELDSLLLLVVVFGKGLQVNFRHFFVLAVELVELEDRIRLALWVGRVVTELVSLAVLLDAHLVALLAAPEVEAISAIDSLKLTKRG